MKASPGILLILLLTAVVAGAWWLHPSHPTRRANVADFESDMTEGLLRGIIQELDAGQPPVYFVAFGEARTEPTPAFVARFADHFPPVRAFTSSVTTPTGLVLETSTGRAGVIIQIISFKEYVPGTFDVRVSLSNQPAGRDQCIYRVFNRGGEWIIKSRQSA